MTKACRRRGRTGTRNSTGALAAGAPAVDGVVPAAADAALAGSGRVRSATTDLTQLTVARLFPLLWKHSL